MPTDIKNQQENKSTHEKNNISLELANFIHQDSVRTISISINKPCSEMFALFTVLYEHEDEPNKKSTIAVFVTYAKI